MVDIMAAFGVGVSEVLIGHPFNTAKVLIQNKKKWRGLPFRHYYRGVKYPFVSSTFFNMTAFPIKERTYKYTNNYFLSGILSGIAVAPPMFFVDTFTINRQTNQPVNLAMFKGTKGLGMTISREMLALSLYFGTYHWMRAEKKYNSLISANLPLSYNLPNKPKIVPENMATPSLLSNSASKSKCGSDNSLLSIKEDDDN